MKKFYAIVAAALMSASIFAAAPTAADLASYQKADHYVACFQAPADATCNDIVWVGTYNSWNLQDPDILKCEELTSFPGWYVVVVPVGTPEDPAGECSGKPVQVNQCGELNWEYQNGGDGTCALVSGNVTIDEKGKETDLKDWSKDEPTIITISAWKNGNNPCTAQCAQFDLTVRVYDPFCESNPTLAPTMKGSWNWDADAVKMTLKGSYYEAVVKVENDVKFKFNNDPAGSWDNQFEYYIPYDEENDVPAKWVQFENFSLDPEDPQAKFYTREGNTLTFDFSDGEKFRYATCGLDTNTYRVVLMAKFPADSLPEAGIEVMGNFGGDATWQNGVMMEPGTDEPGWFAVYDLQAKAAHEFKFREAGDPDWNQVVTISDGKDLQFKFGDYWTDDTWKQEPVKMIELDLSDPTKYCWKTNWVAPEGIENVVLTEKAQKVVVDGVLYIIRDNKMFNVQGTQVR